MIYFWGFKTTHQKKCFIYSASKKKHLISAIYSLKGWWGCVLRQELSSSRDNFIEMCMYWGILNEFCAVSTENLIKILGYTQVKTDQRLKISYLLLTLVFRHLWVFIYHTYECVTDVLHMRTVVHIRNNYICVWVSLVEFYIRANNTKSSQLKKNCKEKSIQFDCVFWYRIEVIHVKWQERYFSQIIHWRLETPKRETGKQCRLRSDATECGIWSASPLFANSSNIFLLEYLYHIAWHT